MHVALTVLLFICLFVCFFVVVVFSPPFPGFQFSLLLRICVLLNVCGDYLVCNSSYSNLKHITLYFRHFFFTFQGFPLSLFGGFCVTYHVVAKIPYIQHEISCDVDDPHARNFDNQLYNGSAHLRTIMHLLTLVHNRIVHAHEPWYN